MTKLSVNCLLLHESPRSPVRVSQDKDRSLYTQNGLLHMLDRNRRIKPGPQRLQESPDKFDVVVSCEERVYDQILESKSDAGVPTRCSSDGEKRSLCAINIKFFFR